ncbi:hypothetical protein [Rhizobium leguminosarum]|uniref:hypothetical protein n=1 Tax=Rhizobium leguminosarum TaxID=384 RepID=UPI00103C03EB|nr:hypothetical protein [Rhizobium leguminosarum]TBZ14673.1 hypothetical protein E0H33_15225 [Rhizobium leguminosarum bv. viciae]
MTAVTGGSGFSPTRPAGDRAKNPAHNLFDLLFVELFKEFSRANKEVANFRFHDSPRRKARPREPALIHAVCEIARRPVLWLDAENRIIDERWPHSGRRNALSYPREMHGQGYAAIMGR